MEKKTVLDTEPKWIDMIHILVELSQKPKDREFAFKELTKIAEIADQVRQAQKKKEKLVFDFTEEQ